MSIERTVKYGVPLLAVILVLGFSPKYGPKHVGPGTYHWLGTDWVGPQERRVTDKRDTPAHTVGPYKTDHVLGLGPQYESTFIKEAWEVQLNGYGWVPVDKTCYSRINVGDVWDNSWKFGCSR